ncbi:hypothetical protein [Poseidonocella sp. HB161398]|uniref:hypothetical protein n=1 Tax=Poseidonocella sp. HB161398 TaxID=2320855 RepID=UPI001108E2C2|nr:hypothetical protein [Poseidonocella sp. HB161398]
MTRHLILHVGSPKCGSTYLQRVMVANRARLAEEGIVYPDPGTSHPGNGLRLLDITGEGMDGMFGNAHTVILSHEDLISMGPRMGHLPEACAAAQAAMTVLVFLRPFSEFIYGDYSQYMKQNFDRYLEEGRAYEGQSFEEFAVTRRSQVTPLAWLKAWQKTTPTPLRIAQHRQIRTTLEDLAGKVPIQWEVETSRANPSLRVADCEDIAHAIAGGLPRSKIRDMFKLAFTKTGLSDHGKTMERTKWLEALFKVQNDNIREVFQFENLRAA